MDNKDPKNRIVIKINGEEKPISRDEKGNLHIEEMAATSESAEESFDWILPDINSKEEKDQSIPPYIVKTNKSKASSFNKFNKFKKSKTQSVFSSLWAIIFVAVVIGTSFGFIVLKTITSKETATEPAAVLPNTQKEVPVSQDQTNSVVNAVPPMKAFVVQGGIYTTEKAAESVKEDLALKKIPARILSKNNSFSLYLGTAESLEKAKSLAQYFKSKEADSFWKEVTIDPGSKAKLTEKENSYLKDLVAVYNLLSEKSSSRILKKDSLVENAAFKAAITKLEGHEKITAKGLISMENTIKTASSIYLSSSDEDSFFKTQEKLLDFLVLYSKL